MIANFLATSGLGFIVLIGGTAFILSLPILIPLFVIGLGAKTLYLRLEKWL